MNKVIATIVSLSLIIIAFSVPGWSEEEEQDTPIGTENAIKDRNHAYFLAQLEAAGAYDVTIFTAEGANTVSLPDAAAAFSAQMGAIPYADLEETLEKQVLPLIGDAMRPGISNPAVASMTAEGEVLLSDMGPGFVGFFVIHERMPSTHAQCWVYDEGDLPGQRVIGPSDPGYDNVLLVAKALLGDPGKRETFESASTIYDQISLLDASHVNDGFAGYAFMLHEGELGFGNFADHFQVAAWSGATVVYGGLASDDNQRHRDGRLDHFCARINTGDQKSAQDDEIWNYPVVRGFLIVDPSDGKAPKAYDESLAEELEDVFVPNAPYE